MKGTLVFACGLIGEELVAVEPVMKFVVMNDNLAPAIELKVGTRGQYVTAFVPVSQGTIESEADIDKFFDAIKSKVDASFQKFKEQWRKDNDGGTSGPLPEGGGASGPTS